MDLWTAIVLGIVEGITNFADFIHRTLCLVSKLIGINHDFEKLRDYYSEGQFICFALY